jgi:hypothetical protein
VVVADVLTVSAEVPVPAAIEVGTKPQVGGAVMVGIAGAVMLHDNPTAVLKP